MYSSVTKDIRVSVEPVYLADRSEPDEQRFFWAYTVEIANGGTAPVQIIARHWIITDANGEVEEVRGPGVVGQQPVLKQGESFEYTSGCPLETAFGSMQGTYEMLLDGGETFNANVAGFALRQHDDNIN